MYFKYNFWRYIYSSKKKFLLPILLTVTYCIPIYLAYMQTSFATGTPTLYEYLFGVLKGCPPYNPEIKSYFEIPLLFFLYYIVFLFMLGNQIAQELFESGPVVLTRVKRRRTWLGGIYLFGCFAAFVFWALVYLTAFLFSSFSLGNTFASLQGMTSQQLCAFFLVPAIIFSVTGIMHITFCLFMPSIISIGVILSLVCASAFLDSKWLLFNHLMLVRRAEFFFTDTTFLFTSCYATLVGAICVSIGILRIGHMDILKREEK